MFDDDTTNGRRVKPPAVEAQAKARAAFPTGRAEKFIAAVARRYGTPFTRSWLSAQTCQFDEGVIWTGSFPTSWLRENCSDLLASHRVQIRHDAESREHFAKGQAEAAQTKAKAGAG